MQGTIDNELIEDKKKELSRLKHKLSDYRIRLKRIKRIETKEPYYVKYLKTKVKIREIQQEIYFIKNFRED